MTLQEQLQHKIDFKTKPLGSLGLLEKLALRIGLIQNTLTPQLSKPSIIVFAADHGIVDEGVSPFPKEVTYQMVMNFLAGGAAINVFCKQNDIHIRVVDAGVDFDFPDHPSLVNEKINRGTKNILIEPAMSHEECLLAMEKGKRIAKDIISDGCNIIGFGEMGIGNTSAAALLMHKYTGIQIEQCTGVGTGLNDEGLNKKVTILKNASTKYYPENPVDILATFGGFEIAMMCGAMIQAAAMNTIIMIDGFIATSAILAASKINKSVLDNCIFTHLSGEKGHKALCEYLDVEPLLSIGMRLGEGTGAAVAYPVIKAAVSFLNEMASFESAGVSKKKN